MLEAREKIRTRASQACQGLECKIAESKDQQGPFVGSGDHLVAIFLLGNVPGAQHARSNATTCRVPHRVAFGSGFGCAPSRARPELRQTFWQLKPCTVSEIH